MELRDAQAADGVPVGERGHHPEGAAGAVGPAAKASPQALDPEQARPVDPGEKERLIAAVARGPWLPADDDEF